MGTLDGQVAIVSGAAAGIGAGFVRVLRAAGATVVGFDINPGADRIADAADADAVKALVDEVAAEHGRLDIVIPNAGIARVTHPTDPWEKAVDDFDAVFAVNTRGPFLLGRAAVPHLIASGGGNIVVILTDHVMGGPLRNPIAPVTIAMDVYDSSKWALKGFVDSWAGSLAPHGIRVNGLCMGATDSKMLRDFMGERATPEVIATWMKTDEVAQLAVDLVAEGPAGRSGGLYGAWVGVQIGLPVRSSVTR
jgi:NAD(P)-dependent dehydrogenase (short-subunit alcohol dehydrogenase family)